MAIGVFVGRRDLPAYFLATIGFLEEICSAGLG
jgi:hypothetical protein